MVGDEDHGALLDRDRDPLRRRLRALLPRLHVLPALTAIVVDLGGNATPAALEQAGSDGDVLIVDESPDRLDELRHACAAPNVFFLLGSADVLPLPNASVDAVLGADEGDDLLRVLRP